MKKKLRVGILFGGRSGEHEISLLSAASILKAIDRKKYDVVPIGIDKQGKWLTGEKAQKLIGAPAAQVTTNAIAPAGTAALAEPSSPLAKSLDVVFPVLHGTFGEDGTIQGLFELADIAYVGSGVLGSAAGMDKDAMKRLFAAAGLPQTPYLPVLRNEWRTDVKGTIRRLEKALAYPLFVKPANLGSSVGISKVHDRSELGPALDLAASFDRKIVVEQGVGGPGVKPRELEVSVLGNDEPEASVPGEIIPSREFYDYEAKYLDEGSKALIPAELPKKVSEEVRRLSIEAFKAIDGAGMSRVDFLLERGTNKLYLNEVNTIPGFTTISMFAKLWAASGVEYPALLDRLIALALQRHTDKQQLRTSMT